MSGIRVLLVGRQRTLTQSLAEWMRDEPDLEVIHVVSSPAQARATLSWVRADVALVDADIRVPGDADLIRAIGSAPHPPRIVLLTDTAADGDLVQAVLAGVSGWVEKCSPVDHLLAAVRGVAAGETWIPPRLLSHLVDAFRQSADSASPSGDGLGALTQRERDVLACMVAGRNRAQIAAELVLSQNTVRTHAQNVLRKLGVHSSLAAVALARRAGLPARAGPQPSEVSGGRSV